jgi:hypothetical protein
MIKITGKEALANKKAAGVNATWAAAGPLQAQIENVDMLKPGMGGERIHKDFVNLTIRPKFQLSPEEKFFATGSCFARNIESALSRQGIEVLSFNEGLPIKSWFWNRYNSFTILQDFLDAFNDPSHEKCLVNIKDSFFDYTQFGKAATAEEVIRKREIVRSNFKNIKNASTLIITLGLIEVWYDKEIDQYLNIAPSDDLVRNPDRYELRITDYNENLAALEKLYDFLTNQLMLNLKIIITVSPVPFSTTFSGQDVIIANTLSKSTLRAVAGNFCNKHENVDYFPSYELVTLSNPNSAWEGDKRHVRQEFVDLVMGRFISSYIEK